MCDDECSEEQERDDQSNVDKILQDYNIHRSWPGVNSEILCICIHTMYEYTY